MHHNFFGQHVAACPSVFPLAEVEILVRKQAVEAEKESQKQQAKRAAMSPCVTNKHTTQHNKLCVSGPHGYAVTGVLKNPHVGRRLRVFSHQGPGPGPRFTSSFGECVDG